MLEFRRSLPAYKEKDLLLTAISQNQVCYGIPQLLTFFAYQFGPLVFEMD